MREKIVKIQLLQKYDDIEDFSYIEGTTIKKNPKQKVNYKSILKAYSEVFNEIMGTQLQKELKLIKNNNLPIEKQEQNLLENILQKDSYFKDTIKSYLPKLKDISLRYKVLTLSGSGQRDKIKTITGVFVEIRIQFVNIGFSEYEENNSNPEIYQMNYSYKCKLDSNKGWH